MTNRRAALQVKSTISRSETGSSSKNDLKSHASGMEANEEKDEHEDENECDGIIRWNYAMM